MLRLHQCAFFIDIHLFARDDTQHKKCMTLIRKENIKFEYKYFKNLIKLDFKNC